MPPKRGALTPDADSIRLSKSAKIDKNKPVSSLETEKLLNGSGNKETIAYDEYLEGGIPDVLLQGLGFSEEDKPTEEEQSEENETLTAEPLMTNIAMMSQFSAWSSSINLGYFAMIAAQAAAHVSASVGALPVVPPKPNVSLASGLTTQPSHHQQGKQRVNKDGKTAAVLPSTQPPIAATASAVWPAIKTANVIHSVASPSSVQGGLSIVNPSDPSREPAVSVKSAPITKIVKPKPSNEKPALESNNPRFPAAMKTTTRGNIKYERLPTGEVVASLIKKPGEVDNDRTSSRSGAHNLGRKAETKQNQPTFIDGMICPSDYPITEHNVAEVLDQSIQVTQSMRMLLTSLRDELRRVGGTGSSMVTAEQVRKRTEVASKLATAYAAYKQSIENIENVRFTSGSNKGVSAPSSSSSLPSAALSTKKQKVSELQSSNNRLKPDRGGRQKKKATPRQEPPHTAINGIKSSSCEMVEEVSSKLGISADAKVETTVKTEIETKQDSENVASCNSNDLAEIGHGENVPSCRLQTVGNI